MMIFMILLSCWVLTLILQQNIKGSAIFIHCCSHEKNYTEGCVALKKKHLIELIKHITPLSKLVIY